LSVVLALQHLRTIVAGQEIVINTDRLNNTVFGESLASSEKVLRMLLNIEGVIWP